SAPSKPLSKNSADRGLSTPSSRACSLGSPTIRSLHAPAGRSSTARLIFPWVPRSPASRAIGRSSTGSRVAHSRVRDIPIARSTHITASLDSIEMKARLYDEQVRDADDAYEALFMIRTQGCHDGI